MGSFFGGIIDALHKELMTGDQGVEEDGCVIMAHLRQNGAMQN